MDKKNTPNIKLNMVSPCNKDWTKMSPTEKGRYCKACKKEVVNLVGLDEKELNKIVSQQPTNFCGRIEPSRLNSITNNTARFSFRKIAASILMGIGLTWLFPKHSDAQTIDASKMNDYELNKNGIKLDSTSKINSKIKIEGRIRDKNTGEVLPFANIIFISSNVKVGETTTDIDGKFNFDISDSTVKVISIKVSDIGYESFIISDIHLDNSNLFISLNLQQGPVLGLTMIIITKPRLVDPDNTSTGSVITKGDIQHMAH